MRRVILWLLGTAVGTAALLGVKAAPGVLPFGGTAAAPLDPVPDPVAAGGSAAPDVTSTTAPQAPPGAAGKPAARTTPPATRQPAQPKTTTPAAPPAPASRTILGTAVPAKDFGTVQVKVVVTGKHIDDVVVVQMSNRPRNAPSLLRQEALAEQSAANLSIISGATYTSQAYAQSLQSALAKA